MANQGYSPDQLTNEDRVEEQLPELSTLPEVRIYSHSTLVYWWPIWFFGFLFAAISFFNGGAVELDNVRREWFHPSSALGISYVALLLLVIVFTNLKMRGMYSAMFVLAIAFISVLFAWLGWWDDITAFIPHLSVHMNMGFYLVFSTCLLALWLLSFFVFDRLVFWRVRPGQMTEEHLVGGAEQSYDSRGMLFEQRGDDLFRHLILGLEPAIYA